MPFLDDLCVLDKFQSGFKILHSTEPALIRDFNDSLLVTVSGSRVVLVMLELFAAFDRVDHEFLLSRLENLVGGKGLALDLLVTRPSG